MTAPTLFDRTDIPVGAHGPYGPTADGRYVTPYQGQSSVLSIETVDGGLILVRSDHAGTVAYAIYQRIVSQGWLAWRQVTRELTGAEVPRFTLSVRPDQESRVYPPIEASRPYRQWLESAWLAAGADR